MKWLIAVELMRRNKVEEVQRVRNEEDQRF